MGALRAVRAKQILLKSQVKSTPELCSGVCGCLSPAVFARVQFFSGLDGPSLPFPLLCVQSGAVAFGVHWLWKQCLVRC